MNQGQQVHRLQVELELPGLHLGDVQYIIQQAQQGIGAAVGQFGEVPLLFIQRGVLQQFHRRQYRVHRRADLMAHDGQEHGLFPFVAHGAAALLTALIHQDQQQQHHDQQHPQLALEMLGNGLHRWDVQLHVGKPTVIDCLAFVDTDGRQGLLQNGQQHHLIVTHRHADTGLHLHHPTGNLQHPAVLPRQIRNE